MGLLPDPPRVIFPIIKTGILNFVDLNSPKSKKRLRKATPKPYRMEIGKSSNRISFSSINPANALDIEPKLDYKIISLGISITTLC